MRVMQVMASGAVGGGLDHLLGLVGALGEVGVECRVVMGADGPGLERARALGVAVERVDLMRSRVDPRGAWRLRRAVRAAGPDVVHYHGTRAAFFGAAAAGAWGGPPAVYTAHGLAYRQSRGAAPRPVMVAAEAIACRGARDVITVAAADRVDLIRRRLVRAERCHHVPNAVDSARFHPGDREAARARLGLSAGAFVVGSVARLVPQKAVGDLIEAVTACTDIELLVAGDGPERASLTERARAAGGRVRLLGSRDDVPELLRAVDLFALSSRWEGEPVALLEAMASGLPCVATDTEGSRGLLRDGVGVLVGIGRADGLTRAIEALRADPARRVQLGERARRAVADRTPAANAARVRQIYGQVLA